MPTGGVAFNQMGRYYPNGDWSLFMYGVFTTTIGLAFSRVPHKSLWEGGGRLKKIECNKLIQRCMSAATQCTTNTKD